MASSVTELFETIKHDLASVKKMFALCDEYICSQEPGDDYPYFKEQLDKQIAAYKGIHPETKIDSMVITGYKNDYKECENCKEFVSNISCYVNGIRVIVDVSFSSKYTMNIHIITISNDNDAIVFRLYQTDIQHLCDRNGHYRNDLHKYDWLVSNLAKTGHTVSEFAVILQALCS